MARNRSKSPKHHKKSHDEHYHRREEDLIASNNKKRRLASNLNQAARKAQAENDYEKAIRFNGQAYQLYLETDDKINAAKVACNLSFCYSDLFFTDKETASRDDDLVTRGILMQNGFYWIEKACSANPQLRFYQKRKKDLAESTIGFVPMWVGLISRTNITPDESVEAHQFLCDLYKELDIKSKKDEAHAYHALSTACITAKTGREGKEREELTRRAYHAAEKAYSLVNAEVHKNEYLVACEAYGNSIQSYRPNRATELFNKSIKLNGEEKPIDPKVLAFCYENLARIAFDKYNNKHDITNLETAINLFEKALKVKESEPKAESISHMLAETYFQYANHFMDLYKRYNDRTYLDSAKNHYLKAIDLNSKYNDHRKTGIVENQLALLFLSIEDYELATKYFSRAFDSLQLGFKKQQTFRQLSFAQRDDINRAQDYIKKKNWQEAARTYMALCNDLSSDCIQTYRQGLKEGIFGLRVSISQSSNNNYVEKRVYYK